jgi:hypothetical protein
LISKKSNVKHLGTEELLIKEEIPCVYNIIRVFATPGVFNKNLVVKI